MGVITAEDVIDERRTVIVWFSVVINENVHVEEV